ncbi:MAG: SBBP repeat-containing protein, partial [Kiritimatiellae bacterium]|nr:SBBP repeat-containing protein [Kiritimatiellia bacterium]
MKYVSKASVFAVLITGCMLAVSFPAVAQNVEFAWAAGMGGTTYYPDASGLGIAVDASGNVYATGGFRGIVDFDPGPGTFNLTSSGGFDIFVQKLDASGNFLWAKGMGGFANSDYGTAIAVDASGNVYTTGRFYGAADFNP